MNIPYGNGVPVVVRDRESLLHGEGEQFTRLKPISKGAQGSMQNSETVLINLSKQASKRDYVFDRLYRNLYNPDFYVKAYANIYKNDGSATAGVDGQTASNFSEKLINDTIEEMKNESYKPQPALRVYIPKKNGNKRPLGIPTFIDRVVQEICRMIIEAIYEQKFDDSSHGFRPKRSCHTALSDIDRTYTGANWFIEGDIKGFFDNIDHHILIELLRKTIKDEKFIRLMWKFLKAGYVEDFRFNKTYTGTPQGGIISPILANIYLHELDVFIMKQLKPKFDLGDRKKDQKRNPEYRAIEYQLSRLKVKIKNCEDEQQKLDFIKEYKLMKQKHSTMKVISDSTGFKRIKYVRYADDFLIGINGSKKDCEDIKKTLTDLLANNLKLELSQEKTLITHSSKKARFLGYDICVGNNNTAYKNKNGVKIRNARKNIRLMVPKDMITKFITDHNLVKDVNAEKWMPIARNSLIHFSDLEIVNIYNAELRGLYNYYRMAENVSIKMWQLHYVMEYSCIKTLAGKHRSTVRKMFHKYRLNGGWGIKYQTKKGEAFCYFYNKGYVRNRVISKEDPDKKANVAVFKGRTELERRISAKTCEWCGKEDVKFEIHHVRRMKDLKGKEEWEIKMIARQRKTIVLCYDCHRKIAHGARK